MAMIEVLFNITTDGSGDSIDNAVETVFGYLYKFVYAKNDFADGVDLVLSVQAVPGGVAETVITYTNINVSVRDYPVVDRVDTVGVAELAQPTRHLLVGKPRIVTAQGGNAKSGKVILYIENAN